MRDNFINNFIKKIVTKLIALIICTMLVSINNLINHIPSLKGEELPSPTITLSVDKTKLENGDDVIFTIDMKYVTLTDLFDGCVLTLYQNDSKIKTVKMDKTGSISFKFTVKDMFKTSFDAYVKFDGNSNYSATTSNVVHYEFVNKITPTITFSMIKSTIEDDYNLIFTGQISSPDNHSFDGEYIDIYDRNELNKITSVKIINNGIAYQFKINSKDAVYHDFYCTYHGNNEYKTVKSNNIEFGILTVVARLGKTEVCEDEQLPISVTVSYGLTLIDEIKVKIYIDNIYIQDLEIVNGIGTFNYTVPHGDRNTHSVVAKFEGEGAYIGANSEPVSYTVSSSKKPILVAELSRKAYTVKENLIVVCQMIYDGKPISGAELLFYLDDTLVGTIKTDDTGMAKLETPLTLSNVGDHKVKVEYIKNNDYFGATAETEKFTVYHKYFLVSFELNGVEATPINPVHVEDGHALEAPIKPINKFYSFKGWYKDQECTLKYDFDSVVTTDFTLYAKWSFADFVFESIFIVVFTILLIFLFVLFIKKLKNKPKYYISNKRKYARRRL